MNSNKTILISDFGEIVTGKTPSSNNPEDFGQEIIFVTPSDDFNKKYIKTTARSLSKDGTKKLKSKLLPPESVMVNCIGSDMGKLAMNFLPAITNQQINSIIVDKSKYDPSYVYYKLKMSYDVLRQQATGSTSIPLLNKTDFSNIEINVNSDLPTQQKIAAVLSALDAKIELNARLNAELESMAKTLYDYWFVQFAPPPSLRDTSPKNDRSTVVFGGGRRGLVWNDELKREIPLGWEVKPLANITARIGTGLNPRKNFVLGNGNNYYVTIKNIDYGRVVLDEKCDRVDDEALRIIDRRSDLQVGDILFTSIEPVGKTYLLREKPANWNINESVFTIRPNYEFVTSEYLYFLLSSDIMKVFTEKSSAGSTFKGIRIGVLNTFLSALPDKRTMIEFSRIVKPILEKIDTLQKESQRLRSLRDWLLPMLMNGQISIKT
ncbi:MAG: restriction endonuclease subunit S [Anaerolineales bacterium]|nr:restriction endonuclease subunit S [Anaerolineales bacterium]